MLRYIALTLTTYNEQLAVPVQRPAQKQLPSNQFSCRCFHWGAGRVAGCVTGTQMGTCPSPTQAELILFITLHSIHKKRIHSFSRLDLYSS